MLCSLTKLKEQDLDRIQSLESELGRTLLGFSCHDVQPAALDEEKLRHVQELENKLGIALV